MKYSLLLCLAFLLFLLGCGGGGSGGSGGGGTGPTQPTSANPSVSLDWPARTRDVGGPSSGLSVSLQLQSTSNSQNVYTFNANRASTLGAHTETYTFPSQIATGSYNLTGTFYASAGESGATVGTFSTRVTLGSNGTLLNSTGGALGQIGFTGKIKSVALVAGQSITTGVTQQLMVAAYDASSNVIIVTPGSYTFTVKTGGSYLNLTPDGVATGITAGQCSVSASVDGIQSPAATVTIVAPNFTPSLTVNWPARTRDLNGPNSALSASFAFQNSAATQTYATIIGNRSTQLTAHNEIYVAATEIPQGAYTVNGTFYAGANQTGAITATISTPVTLASDGTIQGPGGYPLGTIDYTGVIKSVVIAPGQFLTLEQSKQLVVTAFDKNSNSMAVTPGSFQFTVTSGSENLSITPDGIATGVGVGTATVVAAVDGVQSAPATVNVVGANNQVLRFSKATDSIQLTGGALNGACLLGSKFTVEAFVKPTSSSGNIWQQWTDGVMDQRFEIYGNAIQTTTFDQILNATSTFPENQWIHLAWCYNGSNFQFYQNGVQVLNTFVAPSYSGTTVGSVCAVGYSSAEYTIGNGLSFLGDLAGLRISNYNRYTSSFSPPRLPLTQDGSTLMLIDPYSSTTKPTSFSVPGSQGLSATLGAGAASATSPTWAPYGN